jgi:cytochrome c553
MIATMSVAGATAVVLVVVLFMLPMGTIPFVFAIVVVSLVAIPVWLGMAGWIGACIMSVVARLLVAAAGLPYAFANRGTCCATRTRTQYRPIAPTHRLAHCRTCHTTNGTAYHGTALARPARGHSGSGRATDSATNERTLSTTY